MYVGPRSLEGASLRIAVPVALPQPMRDQVRELIGMKSDTPGSATRLMTRTVAEADDTRTPLFLHCNPDGGDVLRLGRFYQRFGFAPIQAMPLLMLRMPNEART